MRWKYKEQPEPELVKKLSEAINVNPVLSAILVQRGIKTYKEAKDFFRPDLKDLHDPFLMQDMEPAVERLREAVSNGQKILIYGDYDVDGTTSVSMVYGFLSRYTQNLLYYIPDRYTEGYGISKQGIEFAIEQGVNLMISLDCGIRAIERIAEARDAGMDVIVCDHHHPGEKLPPARAILDPQREDCPYPYKELSGCGVGFKLLQGFCLREGFDMDILNEYLDLVVVSIASDIVKITGENRILAYFGLKKLNGNPRPGLAALMDVSGNRCEQHISNIVFGIGPRINAAGRIDHAHEAVKLLLSEHSTQALAYAKQVNDVNTERREYDLQITEEALSMIDSDDQMQKACSTVLFKNDWHKGVIGIVASRCIEKYYRPTVILTESNQKATGSVRSVPGFDVYHAIVQCEDLLEQYGGHTYAAGLTLDISDVHAFRDRFEEVVSSSIDPELLTPQINIDAELKLEQINSRFYNILKQMGPFGPGNRTPVFLARDVFMSNPFQVMKEKHVKMILRQEGQPRGYTALGFNMAEQMKALDTGMLFVIAFTIQKNEYQGLRSLVLHLKDIKV
jgi:single-stranded-DNA-specific exonuclease